jgi:hypothetical protein
MSKSSDNLTGGDFEELVNSGKFLEAGCPARSPTTSRDLPITPNPESGAPLDETKSSASTPTAPIPPPVESTSKGGTSGDSLGEMTRGADVSVSSAPPQVEYNTGHKYAGDYVDEELVPAGGYQAFAFRTPAHVLAFFNDDIASGRIALHKWQAEVNLDLSPIETPTSLHPLRYYLVAANGSGKDDFVISPFAIWFILSKIRSRVIITTSSGTQLTAQTETYIKALAESVNRKLGQGVMKIRQRYIRCNISGSEIRMFATDEAGKAEGYHPLEPGKEMAIIKNESKSISEAIHKALKRCTGFNYWLEISSPGVPYGAFHYAVTHWSNGRKVTSYDCPHISEEEREIDRVELGEYSPEYRSKHLAEFTSVDGESVIPTTMLEECKLAPPSFDFPSWPKRVGIDLAAGCDETCIFITKGTRVLKEKAFAEKDTMVTVDVIEQTLTNNGIPKDHEYIFADDGGVGHSIIDNLVRKGWLIKRVLNNAAAYNKKQYGNKGAELWFRFKRFIEEKFIDVSNLSTKALEQLSTRKYKQPAGGRLFLQPKREAKSEGFNSPDRADALVLSYTGLTINDFLSEKGAKEIKPANNRHRMNSDQEVIEFYEGITFKEYEENQEEIEQRNAGVKARGSLQVALGITPKQNESKYL